MSCGKFCLILLAIGLKLSQLGHLHLHLDPWRRSSSRSSAATSSTIPLVAGRRHHQHRPISPRHNLCAAFKPITAAPSTPASPSASCRPLPPQGWHGLAPPLSLRRRSSRCTMGKSAAEQSPYALQHPLPRTLSSGLSRGSPFSNSPLHLAPCRYPSSPSTRSAVSHLSFHLLTGQMMKCCLCMPSLCLHRQLQAQVLASLVIMMLPLQRRI